MLDFVVFGMLVLGFATFVTMHVTLCVTLVLKHPPRYRGLVALVLPPLAAIWGAREKRRGMVGVWIGALVLYGVGRIIAAVAT